MEFDKFVNHLLDESKVFFEQSTRTSDPFSKLSYLHASLLLVMSSLEACINSIVEEIMIGEYKDSYTLLEQSLLLEREIIFNKGHYQLGNGLKISRMIEKIELIYFKFNGKEIDSNEQWIIQLKQSIDFRNKLVHPKEYVNISEKQVHIAIESVVETINVLYLTVYKVKFPVYDLGIQSKIALPD